VKVKVYVELTPEERAQYPTDDELINNWYVPDMIDFMDGSEWTVTTSENEDGQR
jgi:hypothetical protein